MFIGSINEDLRAVLVAMARRWTKRAVYTGCSGNFTVERLLARAGIKELHSNDVSLYSCVIGNYLAGNLMGVQIKSVEWDWLREYIDTPVRTIATLLLCSEMFKYNGRAEKFHERMEKAYIARFAAMHAQTVERVNKALEGVRLSSFFAGDVLEFVQKAPDDCVFVAFPPTYKSGYERLYKKIDEVFEWERPEYQIFDDAGFRQFTQLVQQKRTWVTLRDHEVPELSDYLRARIHTGMRSKPVYVYAADGDAKVVNPHQKLEPVHVKRLTGELKPPLRLMRLSQGQLNTLRSEYLNPKIVPAAASVRLGILAGDELIGALAFDRSQYLGGWCDAYMMTDFPVAQTLYKRLSKLVLAIAISTEVKALLEMSLNMQVRTIGTTAFTEKKASQKYRGLFTLYSRKEGALNYVAQAGQWSMEGAYQWWTTNHTKIQELTTVA